MYCAVKIRTLSGDSAISIDSDLESDIEEPILNGDASGGVSVSSLPSSLKSRSLVHVVRKPTGDNYYKLTDFMDEHMNDNAFGSFQPSARKNAFNNNIIHLVESSLNIY